MKRACTGYRDQLDLMFHHEDVKSKARPERPERRSNGAATSVWGFQSSHDLGGTKSRSNPQYFLCSISPSLLPSEQDLALCYYYETILETVPDADHSRYLHMQLPTLFSQSKPGSALHLATQAISQAVWARSRPNDARASCISRKRYLQSLAALNAAIRDTVEVKSDQTLYAVLLLSGYEVRNLQLDPEDAVCCS